jgi:hypothetical protein
LIFNGREYTRLRTIAAGRLTPEQKRTVEKYLQGEEEPGRKTGNPPGRPSSMHIVEAEFRKRRDTGHCESSLQAEADYLEIWFKKNHPDKQSVTSKTIANRIRDDFRENKCKSA